MCKTILNYIESSYLCQEAYNKLILLLVIYLQKGSNNLIKCLNTFEIVYNGKVVNNGH